MKKIFFALLFFAHYASGQNYLHKSDSTVKRFGTVLTGAGGLNIAEMSVIRDINPSIITVPTGDSVFKAFYTEVNAAGNPHVAYAESFDGINYTVYSGAGDSVISGHWRGNVFRLTNAAWGTVGWYYSGVNKAATQLDIYYSSTGAPGTWSLLHSAVITAAGLGVSNIYNSCINVDPSTGTWYMLLDIGSVTYGFSDYAFTSTDGTAATWTLVGNVSPRTNGPWFQKVGSTWYLFAQMSGTGGLDILPSDIYWWTSTNFTSWTFQGVAFPRFGTGEGQFSSFGQAADPFIVPTAAGTFLYYTATPNGNSSGGATINSAYYNGSFSQMISGTMNQPPYPYFTWLSDGAGGMAYNEGNFALGKASALKVPFSVWENPGVTINGHPGASIMSAENFVMTDNQLTSTGFGTNLFHNTTEGWQLYDSTVNGWRLHGNNSGFTWYVAPSGSRLVALPKNIGTVQWDNTNSNGLFFFGSVAQHSHVMINQASDDGSVNVLQVGGPAEVTNFTTTGNINGWYFGLSNTSATPNLGIYTAKEFNASLTGVNNVFIGAANTALTGTATQNVVIGGSAGALLGSGPSFNTAMGTNALANDVTGNDNTAYGNTSLFGTTGGFNTGVGVGAGRSNTSGTYNSYFGASAGYLDGTLTTPGNLTGTTIIGDSAQGLQSNTIVIGGEYSNSKRIAFNMPQSNAGAWFSIIPGFGTANNAGFKFEYNSITTTAASGTGTNITLTFASQPYIPYHVGQIIVVSGGSPSGYNGVYTVTSCTLTTLTAAGTATGLQTVAFTIVPYGKPTSSDLWAIGPSGDTAWWVGASGTLYALNYNFYNSSQTLTSNRTVTQGGNSLTFVGGTFTIGSGSILTWNPATTIPVQLDAYAVLNDGSTAASGTVTNAFLSQIVGPTLTATNTSVTYTNAYSLYIPSGPTASTNVTVTNSYAFGTPGTIKVGAVVSQAPNETSAATVTLSQTIQDYIFTGTTSTWTLPLLASNQGVRWHLKNAGSGTVTINVSGSDHIYTSSQVTTYSLTAGNAVTLVGGPSNYYQEN